ncbi:hypothetical protein [Horticoccus sp. 23ND18S-11]|uniref:hypothetical protein n=1 Tax=Horticoccus sp. 23ND18S-11 TaxID=3391832 RepID=UPI0039C9DD62
MNSALLVLPKLLQNHRAWKSPPSLSDPVDFFDADEIARLARAAWIREGSRPGQQAECLREVENQLWLSGLLAQRRGKMIAGHADRHGESP